jgi:uncharacterized protein (DUF697 family)
MSDTNETEKIAKRIIHNAAIASAVSSAAFAQVAFFAVDKPLITNLTFNMLSELERLLGKDLKTKDIYNLAMKLLQLALASNFVAKGLIGIIPVLGNIVNSTMTYTLIESVGWAAYEILKNNTNPSDLSEEQIQHYLSLASENGE